MDRGGEAGLLQRRRFELLPGQQVCHLNKRKTHFDITNLNKISYIWYSKKQENWRIKEVDHFPESLQMDHLTGILMYCTSCFIRFYAQVCVFSPTVLETTLKN